MADILELPDVTYEGEYANEILMRKVFYSDPIESAVTILPNITYRQQIVLDELLQDIIRAGGDCGFSASGGPVELTEKWIEPCAVKLNLEQCALNLTATFFSKMLKKGVDITNLDGTEVQSYILDKVQNGLVTDVFRLMWFGDTDLDDNVLEICDGFWPRLITASIGYNGPARVEITDGALGDDAALTALRAVWAAQDFRLKGLPNSEKYIRVTSTIYENYRETFEDRCCGDMGTILLQDGTKQLTFRGIPLIEMTEWDRAIDEKGLGNPNRILYTAKSNLMLGCDVMPNSDSNIRMWYDDKDEKNYIKARFTMGTQFGYPELTVIGY